MHVVILADFAIAEGGAPELAIASAVALAEQGIRVTYLHGAGDKGDARLENNPNIVRAGFGGEDIWSKNILAAVRDGVWNREYLPWSRDLLVAGSDKNVVVHVHQWTKYFSPSVFSVILASGLPMAVSMHDYFMSCPTGLMYRFDTKDACKLTPMSASCAAARCDPRSQMHKMIRFARGLAVNRAIGDRRFAAIHVSEIGQRTIGGFLPPAAKQFVLENPVECADRGPRDAGQASKLVYCGRLTEEKGVLLAAEAARIAELPILFVGDGPARDAIMSINPNAEISGWLSRTEVRERIAREAMAIVAPSRWPETGPLVVAEALAAGVPAIVSDRAGTSSRIDNGINGFVVTPDANAIAVAAQAFKYPDAVAAMGMAAYQGYWRNPSSLQKHAQHLIAIYDEMLTWRSDTVAA